jgi:hypothetical protein
VHGAAASAVAAGGFGGQFGDQKLGRDSLGQRVPVSAMRAGDPIVLAKMRRNTRCDGFFADIEMREAGQFPISIHQLGCQFRPADQGHLMIEMEQSRTVEHRG